MMRHRTVDQENLYQQYTQLGKRFSEFSITQHILSFDRKWELITQEGIWKLPISKQYGGMDLSWQESIIAINGLMNASNDYEFFPFIVNQFSTIYLMLQNATLSQKKLYFPRLIKGELIDEAFIGLKNKNNLIDLMRFKKFLYESAALEFSLSLLKKYGNGYYDRRKLC